MAELNLKALGLEKKWPRLYKLQEEVADLTRRHREAEGQVQMLAAKLEQARQQDLSAEAKALRDGKETPEPTNEPEIQKALESATRNRDVYGKALEDAQGDLGSFQAKHQSALYKDVLQVRADFARAASEGAAKALAAYGPYRALEYTLRDLGPPLEDPGNFPVVLGVHTTGSSEPDRGTVEGWLQHVVSLARDPASPEEGSSSSAA